MNAGSPLLLSVAAITTLASCRSEPDSGAWDVPDPSSPRQVAESLATQVKQPLNVDDPESCAVCHAAVYSEWTESMHAKAHHSKDPLYGAMRAFRMGLGQPIEGKCENCHAPRAEEDWEGEVAQTGVSCATCHHLDHVKPGTRGRRSLTFATDGTMRSHRDVPPHSSPVHGNGPALEALADGKTLCLTCHGTHKNPAKVPVCTTGAELDAHEADLTCVQCHMPEVQGPSGAVSFRKSHRSHAFLGPHRSFQRKDGHILRDAVAMSVQWTMGGAEVTLKNLSGHGFPTGFPGRVAVLTVQGRNARGETVWRNHTGDPMQQSPGSVLGKVYADAQGRPTLPPLATQLKEDRRLGPNEVRSLRFPLAARVTEVEATLHYRLLPPKAAERLGVQDPALVRPVEVARATARRDPPGGTRPEAGGPKGTASP